MPEASIDEDSHTRSTEDDVCLPTQLWKGTAVDPEPYAAPVQL
jgi:hypothetical protein